MTTTTIKPSATSHSDANSHSLIGNALKLLGDGLRPYVIGMLRQAAGRGIYVPDDADTIGDLEGDVAVMLRVMAVGWNDIFRDRLGQTERSLVSEIREIRNRWAHMESFDEDDLDRALDSIGRLLCAVGATAEGDRVHRAKHRLRQRRYGSEPRTAGPNVKIIPGSGPEAAAPDGDSAVRWVAGPQVKNPEPAMVAPPTAEPYGAPTEPATESNIVGIPATDGADSGERIEILIQRGVSFRRQGEFHIAITSFGHAISINREHPGAWYQRALTWGHMGEFERAINDFNRVISLCSDFADAYNGRGYAQYCLGDDPKAIADFEQALNLAPDDELTRANMEKAQRRWAERGGW